MPRLLLYLSRGVFLYSCFGSDGYTSNGLLLEALFSRHRIAPLLRLWWNLFLQLIPYSYLHKLMPILFTCKSSFCDTALLDQGRLDFDRIFLSSRTIAYIYTTSVPSYWPMLKVRSMLMGWLRLFEQENFTRSRHIISVPRTHKPSGIY